MASLKRFWTMSLACGSLLACGQAVAQIAPGGDKGPIDVEADKAVRYDTEHRAVYSGNVEVVQNGARLNCDVLNIYFYGPGEGPNAPAAPKPVKAPAAAGADDATTGNIKQLVAEGHVFYVTQSESARGEHGVYDAEPDTITMTGAVVVVQGNNVMRGDRMLIDRKSGQTTMISTATGRNNPNRVRGVFYNEGQSAPTGQAAPAAQGKAPAKAPAAPAKKP